MKKILILVILQIGALSNLLSQNPSDSIPTEFKGLNRSEIRQQFLNMDASSDTYALAFKSRKSNRQSITSFSLGGLFVIGGFYGFIEASNRKFGFEQLGINILAITSLGLSISFIIRGANKNKESQNYLDEAIDSFDKK